jgi:hypothetical protein
MRADEIVIEATKTSKVTVVVAVMSLFCKKKCKSRSAIPGNGKAFSPKGRNFHFGGGEFPQTMKPFSENKKRSDFKEISKGFTYVTALDLNMSYYSIRLDPADPRCVLSSSLGESTLIKDYPWALVVQPTYKPK